MKRIVALVTYLRLLMFPPPTPLVGNTDDRVLDWLTQDYDSID